MEQAAITPTTQALALLERFRQSYLPSTEFAEGLEYLTTDELYNRLKESCNDLGFGKDYLYNWMIEQGYHQDNISQMKLVWLLKPAD